MQSVVSLHTKTLASHSNYVHQVSCSIIQFYHNYKDRGYWDGMKFQMIRGTTLIKATTENTSHKFTGQKQKLLDHGDVMYILVYVFVCACVRVTTCPPLNLLPNSQ